MTLKGHTSCERVIRSYPAKKMLDCKVAIFTSQVADKELEEKVVAAILAAPVESSS